MEKYNFEISGMDIHVLYEALCQYCPYVQIHIDNVDNVGTPGKAYKDGDTWKSKPVDESKMQEGDRKLRDLEYWENQMKFAEELIDRLAPDSDGIFGSFH